MRIEPFGVEIWMNAWETKCEWNLAETCVESLSIGELLHLAGRNDDDLSALLPMRMTYGAIEGSDRLRAAIAALYSRQQAENVIVTHGTIGANMLVHRALVSPGDRVVAVVPTYQQHTAIPASLGADVRHLTLRAEDGWLPDLDRLRALVVPGTRLIALTNPNNPTGALIPVAMLEEIAAIARASGAWVLCDEVYRGTDQDDPGQTASMADLYERGVSTAGMSKAFSLAGLRLGWIAGPRELLAAVSLHRDYDTISVGRIDDHFATLALEAAVPLGQQRHQAAGTLVERLVLGELIAQVVAAHGAQARLGRQHPGVQIGEDPLQLPVGGAQLLAPGAVRLEALAQRHQLLTGDVDAQRVQLGHEVAVAPRRLGLALERPQLAPHLTQQVLQARQVRLGGGEPAFALLTSLAVLEDAGRLFDDRPPLLRLGVEHGVDLALGDDHVLLAAHAAVREQLLDVEQPARHAVEGVLALAGAEQRARDRHLGELDRDLSVAVVDRQADLGPTQGVALVRAGEDDVFHLLRSHRRRRLGTEHPGDGVDDVRLARAVRADHYGHARFQLQGRRLRERLEALQGEALEMHALLRDRS